MILHPLTAGRAPTAGAPKPIWDEIQRVQRQPMSECWLIPQPAHSALSGEMAARLKEGAFGHIDEKLARCIAMHDAGWGPDDARAIQLSRTTGKGPAPPSFMDAPMRVSIEAWEASIRITEKLSPIGGLMVSRHFYLISQAPSKKLREDERKLLERFQLGEERRQKALTAKSNLTTGAIEALVAALQFCDLLSLYLCCGLSAAVEFPQAIDGTKVTLTPAGADAVSLSPSPFAGPEGFSVQGLRHPKSAQMAPAVFRLSVS